MGAMVYFVCRRPEHLAAARGGEGRLVIRHGTTAYCDCRDTDDRHEWIATGGVPLEQILERHAREVPLPA